MLETICLPRDVYMLPAPENHQSIIFINGLTNKLCSVKDTGLQVSVPNRVYQHLYAVSDEPIVDNDWTLFFDSLGNLWCNEPTQYLGIEAGHHLNKGHKKIVATTNPDLWYHDMEADEVGKQGYSIKEFVPTIPKIGSMFQMAYVEAARLGNPIKTVNLEYYELSAKVVGGGYIYNGETLSIMGKKDDKVGLGYEYQLSLVNTKFEARYRSCPYTFIFAKDLEINRELKLKDNGNVTIQPFKEKTITLKEAYFLTEDALEFGMQLRQKQLNGEGGNKSGKDLWEEEFTKRFGKFKI